MENTAQKLIGDWSSDEPGNPHLTFDEEGNVKGTDGCNGISSTYTVEGDRVLVEKFASTQMACQGVDDWLRGVSELTIDGGTLQVFNQAGDEIGQLERSADQGAAE